MAISNAQTDLGALGVTIFFVISGYLITQSFERSRSVWRFVKARFLRLAPGLLTVLVLLGLVVGPLVTEEPLGEYLSSDGLRRFMLVNASMLDYRGLLDGVFASNPLASVNASLWSLPVEVRCYLLVFALGMLGMLNRYVALGMFVCGMSYLFFQRELFDAPHPSLDLDATIDKATTFFAGALIYFWRPRLRGLVASGCAGLTLLSFYFGGFWIAEHTLLAYLVMYAALKAVHLPNMARYGDLSYGIYIYAWPVSQLFLLYLGVGEWWLLGLLVTPVTLGLAYLSWHCVEKPALALKGHLLPGEQTVSAGLQRFATFLSPSRTEADRGQRPR